LGFPNNENCFHRKPLIPANLRFVFALWALQLIKFGELGKKLHELKHLSNGRKRNQSR